jgi:hypothetical protein
MRRCYVRHKTIFYFSILIMAITGSCNPITKLEAPPTLAPMSTPEKLKLINGEINTCLLVSPSEVESVTGIKVVNETLFAAVGAIDCKYFSVSDNQVVFIASSTTDTTLKKADSPFSAIETYEMIKDADLNMSEIFRIKDIENFGDQAYSKEATLLEISVLKNDIFYKFVTLTDGGIGYDALIKIAEIALEKMP